MSGACGDLDGDLSRVEPRYCRTSVCMSCTAASSGGVLAAPECNHGISAHRRMQIKKELKTERPEPEGTEEAAESLDSDAAEEAKEAAILEEMQARPPAAREESEYSETGCWPAKHFGLLAGVVMAP